MEQILTWSIAIMLLIIAGQSIFLFTFVRKAKKDYEDITKLYQEHLEIIKEQRDLYKQLLDTNGK